MTFDSHHSPNTARTGPRGQYRPRRMHCGSAGTCPIPSTPGGCWARWGFAGPSCSPAIESKFKRFRDRAAKKTESAAKTRQQHGTSKQAHAPASPVPPETPAFAVPRRQDSAAAACPRPCTRSQDCSRSLSRRPALALTPRPNIARRHALGSLACSIFATRDLRHTDGGLL